MPIIASPMLTLDETKTFLNIDTNIGDQTLPDFIAVASQMIVNRIGVVSGSPNIDEWHDGGSSRISLRNQGPIVSVTTVTESYATVTYPLTQVVLDSGSTGTAYGFSVDLDKGLLIRRASGVDIPFAAGLRNIHISYVAGYTTVPADIKQAAKLLVKHLWETQRGASVKRGTGPVLSDGTGSAFPQRVQEILAVYTIPGIA